MENFNFCAMFCSGSEVNYSRRNQSFDLHEEQKIKCWFRYQMQHLTEMVEDIVNLVGKYVLKYAKVNQVSSEDAPN